MSVVITRKKFRKAFTFLYFSFFSFTFLFSQTVGSDTITSISGYVTFPESDSDNKAVGFISMSNGFSLETYSTTFTFDSVFPVSGPVDFRNGELYLQNDFIFDAGAELGYLCTIYGNEHRIDFSENITTFSAGCSLEGEILQTTNVDPFGDSVNSIDWNPEGTRLIAACDDVDGNDMFLYSLNRDTNVLTEIAGAFTTGDGFAVRFDPTGDYMALGRWNDTGYGTNYPTEGLRVYDISGDTLSSYDSPTLNSGETGRAVAWHPSGEYVSVGTDDATTQVRTFQFSAATGLVGSALTVDAQPDVDVAFRAMDWDCTGSYLAVGLTTTTASELLIYYLQDTSNLTLTYQASISGATSISALDWNPTDSTIAIGLTESGERLRVYRFNFDPAMWSFDEIESFRFGLDSNVYGVNWSADGLNLAVGLALNSGDELRIYGRTCLINFLELASTSRTNDVNDVRIDFDGSHIASGDEDEFVAAYEVILRDAPLLIEDLYLSVNNDVAWKISATIKGECMINARGHRITLDSGGEIFVDSGAQLTIKDSEIAGVMDMNIACSDDTAKLILDNSAIILDDDYRFTKGSISFERDVIITGSCCFSYSSRMASTVAAHSELFIDHGITFSYAPPTDNRDLIYLADKTSIFYFDGSNLYSTTTGMRLINGRLFIDNAVTFSAVGTIPSESISLGNGVEANDLDVTLLPGAELTVYGGVYEDNV